MTFKCASFFAGVGGIDLGFKLTGKFQTIYANEFDIYPARTFELNNNIKVDCRDIKEVKDADIPKVDVYLSGFPCTDISISGERKGLYETDGTYTRSGLFFEVIRLLETNDVPVVFFENVKNLVSHDNGKTFKIITDTLEGLGYYLKWKVLNAAEYGNIPQNRERIYIVGFDKIQVSNYKDFVFPIPPCTKIRVKDILEEYVDEKYTISDKLWIGFQNRKARNNKAGKGFGFSLVNEEDPYTNTLLARYYKDGKEILISQKGKNPRRLTPRECARLQGFPDEFIIPVSDTQAYQGVGNSVAVPVIHAIAEEIIKVLDNSDILSSLS